MKILVIRFSSIGDIVLTTPVVRCLKQQLPDAEIHFITKVNFAPILTDNPYIDRLITIEKSISEVIEELKKAQYDYVIDLHNNIRTLGLKRKLGVKSYSFPKLQVEKWLLVNFKKPMKTNVHITERYFEAVKALGVKNDQLPGDFFIHPTNQVDVTQFGLIPNQYITFAIGAQYATKRLPLAKMQEIIGEIDVPIVLLGGKMDEDVAIQLAVKTTVINLCGKLNLQASASVVEQSSVLLTHDTGLMHIAATFEKQIVSVWGNTVPALGMYPYLPNHPELYSIHEVSNLSCRPCSKIGYKTCPKQHFNCMNLQDIPAIVSDVLQRRMAH